MKLSLAAALVAAVAADGPSPLRRADSSAAVDAVVDKLTQVDPAVLDSALRRMGYGDGRLVDDAERRLNHREDECFVLNCKTKIVACGGGRGSCDFSSPCRIPDNNLFRAAAKTEKHAVRCCSSSWVEGWKEPCDGVWATSSCDMATYDEAVGICDDMGARLCTKDELLDGCAKFTGCHFNGLMVWSSTLVTEPQP